jgi:S-DNA-T family DNA segregation ATPase FtsK/SpoIIIE
MESSTKSQFNTKVIFKQNNNASSLVVCDSDEATKLKQREAIVWMDDKKLMKTMYLDNKMIEQYISDKIEKDHKYLNLDGYLNKNININKENEQKTIKNQEKSNKANKNTIKNQENTKKATNKITGRVKK